MSPSLLLPKHIIGFGADKVTRSLKSNLAQAKHVTRCLPILLQHRMDGSVHEAGSTELLRKCVRWLRTEQALLDGTEYVRVLEEITAAL